MKRFSVKKILAQTKQIKISDCTFCSIQCWNCAYFETDAPDSKGQCRCAYKGRWYFPHEGCGNGITRKEYLERQQEELRKKYPERFGKATPSRSTPEPTYSHENHGSSSRHSGGGGSGATGGVAILLIAGIAILFSMGIVKPTITFKMDGPQISSNQYPSYSLNIVRMDDGSNSYPKNFNGYTADSNVFNEYGKSSIDLKKGGYDIWISHDGVSGVAGNVDVNNAFDKTVSVNTENVQNGSMRMAMIYLQDQSQNAVATENLLITDNNGNKISCTSYKEDGCYILVIPDSQMTQSVITVTIQVDGFEKCRLELDFSKGRTVDGKVTLTSK